MVRLLAIAPHEPQMTATSPIGFIGLGNIGAPMAANIAAAGLPLLGFDAAGTSGRMPARGRAAESTTQVARESAIILLSLPHAAAVDSVIGEIIGARGDSLNTVIDLSTIGVKAARGNTEKLERASIDYVDAPVSGGVAGAKGRRISIMCACPGTVFERIQPPVKALSDKIFHVGERPGQGQALKLLNNFLSATALAATSEAVAFGLRNALSFEVILEVLNASSGCSAATTDKFPNHVANGKYSSGFQNTLMHKDVALFLKEAQAEQAAGPIGTLVDEIWRKFSRDMPASDFTRIYQFVEAQLARGAAQ
jgi:3-hydroxyisobutyrate dehydrogenase